ncbi:MULTISPECIES: RNA polymerase sigma factor [unclassified Aureispira]|uniref:RNA polymerase sigma factor n=1 Tax=unclassified Aureispira TaxID=2649989 RepID=UPI0006975F69|nr:MULTISPECIES: RNA polymerase sigma factor [unclassified Aureispira]WMX15033.1 RNA polymerase sigma factor [Aureispira sp. CCB-E]
MLEPSQHNKDTEKKILSQLRKPESFEKGFRFLVQTYQERLYWHIRQMVNLHDDADEVLQNTFIKTYRGIKNFRGDAQLYTWMYRIATNEALTFLKKKKKYATVDLDNEEGSLIGSLEADKYFDGNQATILLQEALKQLPEKQRQVFIFRYYDELSYNEISIILGTSVGGLKASYHHAVKKIEAYVRNNIDS